MLFFAVFLLTERADSPSAPSQDSDDPITQQVEEVEADVQKQWFDEVSPRIGAVVDQWQANQSGRKSIVIMSVDGETIAAVRPDEQYFTASLYKIYVAYAGYQRIDNGEFSAETVYQGGRTVQECLDLMIRESDSPCAEAMWNDIGKQTITDQMQALGLNSTDLTSLVTTANDTAAMTAIIARSSGLSQSSQQLFLTSMKNQIYRDALNRGFSEDVIVYNKIGFSGDEEYHDVALVDFGAGRQLAVAVLSSGVGSAAIAELATSLESAVNL